MAKAMRTRLLVIPALIIAAAPCFFLFGASQATEERQRFLELEASGCNGYQADKNERTVVWDKVIMAYNTYLDYPVLENAKSLALTLPKDKPDKMTGDWGKALEHIFSPDNYPILDMEVLAGDRWSADIAFRLLNVADGHYSEILLTTLGALVRINPRLFLEVLDEHKDTWFVKNVGWPVWFVGQGYHNRNLARRHNLEMRIKALKSIDDPKYQAIREACIGRLLESIKKISD